MKSKLRLMIEQTIKEESNIPIKKFISMDNQTPPSNTRLFLIDKSGAYFVGKYDSERDTFDIGSSTKNYRNVKSKFIAFFAV